MACETFRMCAKLDYTFRHSDYRCENQALKELLGQPHAGKAREQQFYCNAVAHVTQKKL